MKNLREYVDRKNRLAAVFSAAMCRDETPMDLSKLDDTLAQRLFDMLEGDLSPENLCCDGELSFAQTAKKARHLNGAVAGLKKLGYRKATWPTPPTKPIILK